MDNTTKQLIFDAEGGNPAAKSLFRKMIGADDLEEQAKIFGMDIDWEAHRLTKPREDTTPQWLKNWKHKMADDDKLQDHANQNKDGGE